MKRIDQYAYMFMNEIWILFAMAKKVILIQIFQCSPISSVTRYSKIVSKGVYCV